MSVANKKWSKWQQIAGISVVCGLAIAGCERSDKDDTTETAEVTTEQPAANDGTVVPAISCDNPMVQDRLKSALRNTLNQQAQSTAANYANIAEVSVDNSVLIDKVDGVMIDVQNAAILQEANANGMTTCQASVSMTLPSEDLYQASQMSAANNQPSLQTRLAQNNIRINNNMLVDDAFTYVAGAQSGQIQARIAGQPALIAIVSDVMASSVTQSVVEEQRAERQKQEAARRREAARKNSENQIKRQPKPVTPVEPARPAEPATPPTINKSNNDNSAEETAALPSVDAKPPVTPEAPKVVPKDDSIDMIIVEDESATY
ncbi:MULTISPECIES: hypothetical protein [unclassified Psychrobacter]|uniref:hypothetical protein n=1 Tax=unclassified Psychrobacter TaxID=196806 RepID=UPI003F483540